MDYFHLRNPWQQLSTRSSWRSNGPAGLPWLTGQQACPDPAPKSCQFWLPEWYEYFANSFDRSVVIKDWNPKLYAVIIEKGPWLDMPYIAGEIHFASIKLQKLLSCLVPKKIQWLPIRLRDPYGTRIARRYAIANYLDVQDVIDRKASVLDAGGRWKINENGDFELSSIALSRKRFGNAQLFRIYGCTSMVVIREDLRDELERRGITGCSFGNLLIT